MGNENEGVMREMFVCVDRMADAYISVFLRRRLQACSIATIYFLCHKTHLVAHGTLVDN